MPIMLILLNNKLPKTFNENGSREVIKITEREDMLKVVACFNAGEVYILLFVSFESATVKETYTNNFSVVKICNIKHIISYTRVCTLIVATIYLQLIQNRYMFRSFTVLQCGHQHCLQPVASDVEVVGYL